MSQTSETSFPAKTTGKERKNVIFRNVIIVVLLIFSVGFFIIGSAAYYHYCSIRKETPANMNPVISKYEYLERTEYFVPSDKGLNLAAYLYQNTDEVKDGSKPLVVLSHGLGLGGHILYIDVIDILVNNGYRVFTYDATGCDNSEGKGIYSYAQGLKDLDTILTFVKMQEEFRGIPILLWGHSWGAYNSCAVAQNHPEVIGIAALSGYNKMTLPIACNGVSGKIFYPYITLFNRLISGRIANVTAIESLRMSRAKVFIAHGAEDKMIRAKIGYHDFYKTFKEDERFTLMCLQNRQHMNVYCDDKTAKYRDSFEKGMDLSGYAEADREMWYGADSDLMRQILNFYADCSTDYECSK
ncbi:pimeloyl-ACP methyl ester carboxylesterase [Moryella indoligenes]|uniref:Pimeloyl-ACP methyl ester carboxylesterase n=1 Tax=Moryella indoligenes TaxID=371674 RepID=A0AAE4ALL7_9FIRM|nr:alpha/beta fold hydrolase [Moryella indoligenes]MDQ0153354.1 pimeloyl-ACP methyl ester carboxylesterase [Moryella indoligenes]